MTLLQVCLKRCTIQVSFKLAYNSFSKRSSKKKKKKFKYFDGNLNKDLRFLFTFRGLKTRVSNNVGPCVFFFFFYLNIPTTTFVSPEVFTTNKKKNYATRSSDDVSWIPFELFAFRERFRILSPPPERDLSFDLRSDLLKRTRDISGLHGTKLKTRL